MIPPSGRLPEKGPDWFLVDTEACGGGTSHLGFFWGVWIFIGIFGVGLTSRGSTTRWQGRGRALPPGRVLLPCHCLVDPLDVRPTPKIPINTKTPIKNPRTSMPPLQASVPKRSHLEPCSGTLPEGGIIGETILINLVASMMMCE